MAKRTKKVKQDKKQKKVIASQFEVLPSNVAQSAIETVYTDKKHFRITLDRLEKLWKEAERLGASPQLYLAIIRNDTELFYMKSIISVEKRSHRLPNDKKKC